MQFKVFGIRHVASHELDLALHQVRDESQIAAEPIELGDAQHCTPLAAQRHCRRQLRPIVVLAGLDLNELAEQLVLAAIEPLDDGEPLCGTFGVLLLGADAIIRNKTAGSVDVGANVTVRTVLLHEARVSGARTLQRFRVRLPECRR